MKKRAYLMLGLAALLAVGTVIAAQKFILARKSANNSSDPKAVAIVVAKNVLNYGAVINHEHLRIIAWPKNAIPDGSFTSIDDVVRRDERRVVLRRIEKDEPVLKSKVTGFGGRASLSSIITDDMRAATIRVNDVNGVAGFVLPGDRVDVLITRDPVTGSAGRHSRGGTNLVTDILLQNVKVLGIDQEADDSKDKPSVAKAVTLEVQPRQAQMLTLAQQVGTLSLALRNVNNSDETLAPTVRLRDLRLGETVEKKAETLVKRAPAKTRQVRKPGSSVTIFRALKRSEYDVFREPGIAPTGRIIRLMPPPLPSPAPSPNAVPDRERAAPSAGTGAEAAPDQQANELGEPVRLYQLREDR